MEEAVLQSRDSIRKIEGDVRAAGNVRATAEKKKFGPGVRLGGAD